MAALNRIKEATERQKAIALTSLTRTREESEREDELPPDPIAQKRATIAKLRGIAESGTVARVPLTDIAMESDQLGAQRINVRAEVMRDAGFEALVRDIEKYGVKQNIQLALIISTDGDDYCLICTAGQRRLTAARAALKNLIDAQSSTKKIQRVSRIPATLQQYPTTYEAIEASLSENILRADLPLVDTALGINALFQAAKLNGTAERTAIENIASQYGKDAKTIKLYLKLAGFPSDVLEMIKLNPDAFSTRDVFRHIVEPRNFGDDHIRELMDRFIRERTETIPVTPPQEDITRQLVEQKPLEKGITQVVLKRKTTKKDDEFQRETAIEVRKYLPPVKVKVIGERGKGKIELAWNSATDLSNLLNALSKTIH